MQTLKNFIDASHMTQDDYALSLGPQVTRQMVRRWIKRGALVDSNGWVYPKYVKRNKGES